MLDVLQEIGISGYQVARCVERSATSRGTKEQDIRIVRVGG